MGDYSRFDVQAYLNDKGIEFTDRGKNVGSGWIGLTCVFPGCGDTGTHLGINMSNKTFKCWICGKHGNADRLVATIEKCNYEMADIIIDRYIDYFGDEPEKPKVRGRIQKILPDEEICETFPEAHLRYIRQRNFDPQKIISTYTLKAVYNVGKYKGRIVIPIFLDGRIVTFTSRDITGQTNYRYLDCPVEASIVPVKATLYNIDRVKGRDAILVEGPTDVWRLGPGSVASYTSDMTDEQKKLIIDKGIKHLFIMFDAEPTAQRKAKDLAEELSPFMKTEVITLRSGDPGDLTDDEAKSIVRDLLGRR